MSRAALPENYETTAAVDLVDWVSTGKTPANCSVVIANSVVELVAVGSEPEGYVPGGGRCVKLSKSTAVDRVMFDLALPAPVDFGSENCVLEAAVYYPGPFCSGDQGASCGIGLMIGSGGYITNRYSKDYYPDATDPLKGWNAFSFPLQSINNTVGMQKSGSPNVAAMNYLRFSLENTGATGAESRYAYLGPIRIRRKTRPKVCISFDDGLRTIYDNTNAFTLMQSLGIPANLGLITDTVDTGGTRLSWAEIATMAAAGWDIVAHSKTHANFRLDGLTEAQIEEEISGSIDAVRAHGYPCDFFIWPGGAYTETAKEYALESGIKSCFDIGLQFVKTPYGVTSGIFGAINRVPAENTGGTTTALSYVDKAIRHGYSCFLYAHSIIAGASGANTTNETEWATLMQALALRRSQGLIDIVNFSDWYSGLSGTRPAVSRVA